MIPRMIRRSLMMMTLTTMPLMAAVTLTRVLLSPLSSRSKAQEEEKEEETASRGLPTIQATTRLPTSQATTMEEPSK